MIDVKITIPVKLTLVFALIFLTVIPLAAQGYAPSHGVKSGVGLIPTIPRPPKPGVSTPIPSSTSTPPSPLTFTVVPTDTATASFTATPTSTETGSPTSTEASSATTAPSATDIPPTLTLTEEATTETLAATEVTAETPTGTLELPTVAATEEATEEVVATEDATETPTNTESPTMTPTETLTPTATIPMTQIKGIALYQNHKSSAGIQVTVVDSQNDVLSETTTDDKGNYTVQVPAKIPYTLAFSAPLNLTTKVSLQPKAKVPKVILKAGDLDQDGCIGSSDLGLMTASFDAKATTADLTGDGIVDARDLAILAGNFEAGCPTLPVPTAEPTDLSTPATATQTEQVSNTPTLTPTPALYGTLAKRLESNMLTASAHK